jgi:hypothetical protein
MKISKAHQRLADRINRQEVLTHPENYLGPNWEEVINFWLYLDTLSENQLLVVNKRYWDLSYEERNVDWDKALVAAGATAIYIYSAGSSAYCSVSYVNNAALCATYELIGLDKLLENGQQPVFFPLFLNP